jgi:hypothetical protein
MSTFPAGPCNDRDVGDPVRTEASPPAWEGGSATSRRRVWMALLLGLPVLLAGAAATFLSSNEAGSAALVVGGTALLLVVLLGDRLESLKVGNVEFRLREAALHLSHQANLLEARGHDDAAQQLREEAERLLLRASSAAREYEELRRIRPPGAERIADLNKIVNAAAEFSEGNRVSQEAARQIFTGGGDGERVYALALMQANPDAGDVDCILDSVLHSRSAFEQGQALRAALKLISRLDITDRRRLADAVRQQMGPGGHIERSTDRRALAQQILASLND